MGNITELAKTAQLDPSVVVRGKDVASLVKDDIEARISDGAIKYGQRLTTHNGRVALLDAYQEILDLAVYLRQALEELSLDPSIIKLAKDMQYKLNLNAHKEHWLKVEDARVFIKRLEEEVWELKVALSQCERGIGTVRDIQLEAADVANIAMMIADCADAGKVILRG